MEEELWARYCIGERHDHARGQSSDTAIGSYAQRVSGAARYQREDGPEVALWANALFRAENLWFRAASDTMKVMMRPAIITTQMVHRGADNTEVTRIQPMAVTAVWVR